MGMIPQRRNSPLAAASRAHDEKPLELGALVEPLTRRPPFLCVRSVAGPAHSAILGGRSVGSVLHVAVSLSPAPTPPGIGSLRSAVAAILAHFSEKEKESFHEL